MMRRSSALIALVAATTVGCGNLSQEDLIFLAGVPPKEAVELLPAGAQSQVGEATQALHEVCEEGDLRCTTHDMAEQFNAGIFKILDLIDLIVRQPPSQRRKGRRLWGPFFDEGKGATHRFEMVRLDDGITFAFCLHAAVGRVDDGKAKDVTCATDVDDSGLALVFSGQFTPGDERGARARSGVGSITLELARIPEMANAGKRMLIDFDNTDGTHIDITVEGGAIPSSALTRPFVYSFAREGDQSGRFLLETFAPADNNQGLFFLQIETAWLSDQSGRAEAQGSRLSDLDTPVASYTQCWSAEQQTVYARFVSPDNAGEAGDVEQCSIDGPLIE